MENQKSICDWAHETFGNATATTKIVDRFFEEVVELRLNAFTVPYFTQHIQDECADCLIMLYQVAGAYGFDLQEVVDEKMKINRERKWHTTGDGTGQHL